MTCLAERPRPRLKQQPTVAQAVRRFCLECLGATTARGAFDCLSGLCPLYVCMPFRGKPMPKSLSPTSWGESAQTSRLAAKEAARAKELASTPKRRPSLRLIHAQCRQCQPGDRTDCGATDCGLYPFRPWDGPGKASMRRRTERQAAQLAAARARSPLTISRSRGQKPSTAVGAASDG